MATGNQGLGSNNMSDADKTRIHSMGGKASGTSAQTATGGKTRSSSTGRGSNLTQADRSKGGKANKGSA